MWPSLEHLNLSYNHIPVASICFLRYLGEGKTGGRLRVLDLSGNGLNQLPDDLSFLTSLEKLNLSRNQFSSQSTLCNPSKLFVSLATLPHLSKLNLSFNQLTGIHLDDLLMMDKHKGLKGVLLSLVKLDMSFNRIERQEHLMQALHFTSLNILKILGNPLVANEKPMTLMQS